MSKRVKLVCCNLSKIKDDSLTHSAEKDETTKQQKMILNPKVSKSTSPGNFFASWDSTTTQLL